MTPPGDRTGGNRRGYTVEEILRRRGDWLGASCVPRFQDAGLVFAAHVVGGRLRLSGVGGKVEPDETFAEAVVREWLEETEARPTIAVAHNRRHLTVEAEEFPVPAGASAVVTSEVQAADGEAHTLWIAIFTGVVERPPHPIERVPYFAILPPGVTREDGTVDLDMLLAFDGTRVRPARHVVPPAVTDVEAVLTARSVLGTPGLVSEWWAATAEAD